MSKLKALLTEQEERQAELNAVSKFLDQITGRGKLVMTAVSSTEESGIEFNPEDIGLELKVLQPLYDYQVERSIALDEVNTRVEALETLA